MIFAIHLWDGTDKSMSAPIGKPSPVAWVIGEACKLLEGWRDHTDTIYTFPPTDGREGIYAEVINDLGEPTEAQAYIIGDDEAAREAIRGWLTWAAKMKKEKEETGGENARLCPNYHRCGEPEYCADGFRKDTVTPDCCKGCPNLGESGICIYLEKLNLSEQKSWAQAARETQETMYAAMTRGAQPTIHKLVAGHLYECWNCKAQKWERLHPLTATGFGCVQCSIAGRQQIGMRYMGFYKGGQAELDKGFYPHHCEDTHRLSRVRRYLRLMIVDYGKRALKYQEIVDDRQGGVRGEAITGVRALFAVVSSLNGLQNMDGLWGDCPELDVDTGEAVREGEREHTAK